MVFKDIKKLWTQPQPDQCVPTAIKTVLDNQFSQLNIPSLSSIGRMCQYRNAYGAPIDKIKGNLKQLESMGIQFHEKEEANIDFLKGLLEQGIFPMILFHLKDYNKWKRGSVVVEGDDEIDFHMIIVVEVNPQKQEIRVFDTIHDRYKNYKNHEKYDTIIYQKVYSLWTSEDLIYPVFWFTELPKPGKKTQKRLFKNE